MYATAFRSLLGGGAAASDEGHDEQNGSDKKGRPYRKAVWEQIVASQRSGVQTDGGYRRLLLWLLVPRDRTAPRGSHLWVSAGVRHSTAAEHRPSPLGGDKEPPPLRHPGRSDTPQPSGHAGVQLASAPHGYTPRRRDAEDARTARLAAQAGRSTRVKNRVLSLPGAQSGPTTKTSTLPGSPEESTTTRAGCPA